MDSAVQRQFTALEAKDKQVQYEAYKNILKATELEVNWAYEVWDQLKEELTHFDHHKRSRAAQFLASLAISDLENRMLLDFSELWKVTKDERFVTARHSLQAIWKVGLAGREQTELVINHLTDRFRNCEDEKNYTLIRSDIIQNLRNL